MEKIICNTNEERDKVFERYLTWNNICGWSSEILAVIGDIYNVTLKEFDT